jgi:hypothetical protein
MSVLRTIFSFQLNEGGRTATSVIVRPHQNLIHECDFSFFLLISLDLEPLFLKLVFLSMVDSFCTAFFWQIPDSSLFLVLSLLFETKQDSSFSSTGLNRKDSLLPSLCSILQRHPESCCWFFLRRQRFSLRSLGLEFLLPPELLCRCQVFSRVHLPPRRRFFFSARPWFFSWDFAVAKALEIPLGSWSRQRRARLFLLRARFSGHKSRQGGGLPRFRSSLCHLALGVHPAEKVSAWSHVCAAAIDFRLWFYFF